MPAHGGPGDRDPHSNHGRGLAKGPGGRARFDVGSSRKNQASVGAFGERSRRHSRQSTARGCRQFGEGHLSAVRKRTGGRRYILRLVRHLPPQFFPRRSAEQVGRFVESEERKPGASITTSRRVSSEGSRFHRVAWPSGSRNGRGLIGARDWRARLRNRIRAELLHPARSSGG